MAQFASKAASGVRKGLKVARVKSKEAVGVVGARRHLAHARQERKAAVEELGELVCRMLEEGRLEEETLRSRSAAIADIDERIRQSEEEIEAVHDQAAGELDRGEPD
jgi:hypothetical protein